MVKKHTKVTKLNPPNEEVENYDFIPINDWTEREEDYLHRLNDIQICKSFVNDAVVQYRILRAKDIQNDEWQMNFNRDGLPNQYGPHEIRMFIEKMRHFENVEVDNTIDWTLAINERSILTQDPNAKDLTRKTLFKEICPNIGSRYDKTISKYIKVLRNVKNFLGNDIELRKHDLRHIKEIILLKYELESEMHDIFDRFTYRILSSMDTYMTTEDGLITNYCYKGNDFDMHIWALRDIPKNFKQMELPLMIAEMPCVGVKIQIPLSCLSHNMTLRCVHTFFDYLTPNAKTYEQFFIPEENEIIAGVEDLQAALLVEFSMQIDIIEDITKEFQNKRDAYERYILEYKDGKQDSSKSKKKNKTKKKRKVIPKDLPKEPEEIPPDMLPNPQKIFLKREQRNFEFFLSKNYHPDKLELESDEINLKKYIMLGGAYNLFYVHNPKRNEFGQFNITNHDRDRKLIILKDIVADLNFLDNIKYSDKDKMQDPRKNYTWSNRLDINQPPISNARINATAENLEYFFVTFKLPKHLCHWGIPSVCQYEESDYKIKEVPILDEEYIKHYNLCTNVVNDQESESKSRSEGSSPRPTDFNEFSRKTGTLDKVRSSEDRVVRISEDKVRISEDKVSKLFKEIDSLKSYSKTLSTKQLSNIYRPRISTLLRHSRLPEQPQIRSRILNFNLADNSTLQNMRNLEHYCMPHIISSFKFPMELREEQIAEDNRRATSSPLVRNLLSEETIPISALKNRLIDFNYESQHLSERLFPVFSDCDIAHFSLERPSVNELHTFQNLLDKLESIESNYKKNNQILINQKEFFVSKIRKKRSESIIKPQVVKGSKKSINAIRIPSKTNISYSEKSDITLSSDAVGFETHSIGTASYNTNTNTSIYTKYSIMSQMPENDDKSAFVQQMHWTTKHIVKSTLDPENLSLTVQTNRLGIFGFAYKRYEHFPFKFWSMEPSINHNEIDFILDTKYVRVVLNISNKGYTGYVTDPVDKYVPNPFKYVTIDEPITDLKALKKLFIENNINIFSERDASFYIENGYFSEKHLATEYHVYKAIALHCLLLKFFQSDWNRLASRRNIILCLLNPKDKDEKTGFTVRVTPEGATFVEIKELCSDTLEDIKLEYTNTWRNINDYTDLHMLINSLYSNATDIRNRDAKLINYVLTLLSEIRPLSYS